MTAESALRFEALEVQAEQIMGIFARAGYERVAPSFIQPADIFLDCIGEALRNRTYVFTDPDGQELCLRPDLTIPACRIYLERNPHADAPARYAYNGPAFRYQAEPDALRPREFRQAGIENFGAADREQADAEVLALILDAVRLAGLTGFEIRCGDLGLFRALLSALPIPARWQDRLLHSFWRPGAFQSVLRRLASPPAALPDPAIAALAERLDPADPLAAEQEVAAFLDAKALTLLGARNLGEITTRLLSAAADMREQPLSGHVVTLVEDYLKISGTPDAALAAIAALSKDAGIDLAAPLAVCRRRQVLLREADIDTNALHFDADFGRQFEYYSGFVFQIELPGRGIAGQIAGGGRYDGLLASIGAERDAPAIGSAIHTERLLASKGGAR
ncbi:MULTISPECIES: ATP phosphoribosyltransferase regulatory subunit [Rhodomicrobium]|uniref:ATP phosphoribosyltransferase regulatory subunit n=1 Tax=Rhodomicrobium TaxID=1068 RepID=UPI000B4A6BF0|nr:MULTISPECIES: ATP phosphoribosyltransferase regulatory subunit [Rhodomicrobium]